MHALDPQRRQLLRYVPLVLCGFLGIDWSRTGFRYLQFYSGGSGFVVPVPGVVILLLVCGLMMIVASVLSFRFRRVGSGLCIGILVVMVVATIVQTLLHARPSEVFLRRSGLIVLYLSVAVALYWSWIRKGEMPEQGTNPSN